MDWGAYQNHRIPDTTDKTLRFFIAQQNIFADGAGSAWALPRGYSRKDIIMTMQDPNNPNRDLPPRQERPTDAGWAWGWWVFGALVVLCIIAWAGWGWNWGQPNTVPRAASPVYRYAPTGAPAGYRTGPTTSSTATPANGYIGSTTQP
jgi:hypothetical protein